LVDVLDEEVPDPPGFDVGNDEEVRAQLGRRDAERRKAREEAEQEAAANIKFEQPELSAFEAKAMAKARTRQRDNITTTQVCWGKEFTGHAFLAKPEQILFKDFEVGRTMRRSITLTNVSYTFNTFRVVDLPDDIKDFFVVKYTRPGRMSAGMACTVHITFTPKLNRDIEAFLPCLAHTGAFKIPLLCYTKKAKPEVTKKVFAMEHVVMGEKDSRTLYIENKGALSTDFTLTAITDGDDVTPEALATVAFPRRGVSPCRKKTGIVFTFSPPKPMEFLLPLRLSYADPHCADVLVQIRCSSIKVPIYVEEVKMDMRCCVLDKLYRAPLVLRNRGKTALKVFVRPLPELGDALSFNPDLGFVQAPGPAAHPDPDTGERLIEDGQFKIGVKFRPTRETLERCRKFLVPGTTDVIAVPVRVHVPQQVREKASEEHSVPDFVSSSSFFCLAVSSR
jgi:hypothetical protein